MKRGFVSDNCAPVHPAVMEALAACNAKGHLASYGADEDTGRGQKVLASALEKSFPIEFVFNGTGANVLALACCVRPFESIICADCAHIHVDETGAPERVLGSKLQVLPSEDGKITPDQMVPLLLVQRNQHHAQPRVISITNVTEWGAVYTPDEVRRLADFAHANEMLLHVDGARIANAAVAAGCSLADLTWKAGVDIMSYGGCKNGLMFGEAVIFFNKQLAANAQYIRKNVTQLHSKMRYIGAQYAALHEASLWQQNAQHANDMAKRLEAMLSRHAVVAIVHPAQANIIFARMPYKLSLKVSLLGFGADLGGLTRFVTAWDTQQDEIDALDAMLSQEGDGK